MLVDVKCPHCGATMQFDNTRNTVFCPYCGGQVANAAVTPKNPPVMSNQPVIQPTPPKTASTVQNTSPNTNKIVLFVLLGIFGTAFLFFFGVMGTLSGNNMGKVNKDETYNLYLDISSDNHLLLNTYDIAISLDGEELGLVSDGERFTYLAEVRKGEHEILFCKSGSSTPKATKKIKVSNDMTYSCELSHESFSIRIKNEKTLDNIDGSNLEVIDVTGIPLSVALDKLKAIGFTNVREEPYSEIWEKANWIVSAQSVAPGSHIDKNDHIQLDCISGKEYFNSLFSGKNINECEKTAVGAWYNLEFKDTPSHSIDISTMSDAEKECWIVKSADYGRADQKVYIRVEKSEKQDNNTNTPSPTVKPTITNTPTPSVAPTAMPTSEQTESTASETKATSTPTTTPRPTNTPKPEREYYSTNNKDTVKDGNKGVYAYSSIGKNYTIYLIIDFDEGYVYRFIEGNGDAICDKVKIVSGDLNSYVLITYHDGNDKWSYGIRFAWKRQPGHVILQEETGFETNFYPTDLDDALILRDKKEIISY